MNCYNKSADSVEECTSWVCIYLGQCSVVILSKRFSKFISGLI